MQPSELGGRVKSHAQVPVPLLLEDRLRIFFASRCERGLSHPFYVDVDPENPGNIIQIGNKPILELGPPGSFDEFGIIPSGAVLNDGRIFFYYGAWSRLNSDAPYHNTGGLAISDDGGETFTKFPGPVLDRTHEDTLWSTSPFVFKHNDAWRCLYTQATDWQSINGKLEPTYHIKQTTSKDGINWSNDRPIAIKQATKDEAITRATVVRSANAYEMWFSYRKSTDYRDGENAYRIGYAKSDNAIDWVRDDSQSGIALGEPGDMDGLAQAYPYAIRVGDSVYLFYNGNGFGEGGILYATGS